MISNEERHDVAARLRMLADENTVTATPSFNHVLFSALGGEPPSPPSVPTLGDLEAYDKALLYRLADLIEPEPERTCHFRNDGHGLLWCDADGCDYDMDDCFPIPNYCPNCGSKLVERCR